MTHLQLHFFYGLYGISFTALGLMIWARTNAIQDIPSVRLFQWLALFGLLHGLQEFISEAQQEEEDLFFFHQTGGLAAIGLLLKACSFAALFRFAIELLGLRWQVKTLTRMRRVLALLLALWGLLFAYALLANSSFSVASAMARFAFGVPGALLAAIALIQYSRHMRPLGKVQRHFYWAGWGFGGYFAFSIFGSKVDFFPLNVINQDVFLEVVGVPIALPRALCALFITYCISRSLAYFGVLEKERLIATAERMARSYRENEELFRTSFEQSAIGMILVTLHETVYRSNDSFGVMVGQERKELFGRYLSDLLVPDSIPVIHALLERLRANPTEPQRMEVSLRHARGHEVWVGLNASMVLDADGVPRHFVMQTQDVSERKRAELVLEEKSCYLDNILSSSTDFAIAATDIDFVIQYFNPVAERIFGHRAQDVIGRTVMDVHTKEKVSIERFNRAIGIVNEVGAYYYEFKKQSAGDERIIEAKISGIRNPQGAMVGFVFISQDVTVRRRQEEELRLHRDHLDQLVQERTAALEAAYQDIAAKQVSLNRAASIIAASKDHISLLSDTCIYLEVNDSYLMAHGRPREEIVGHTVVDLLGEELFAIVRGPLDECLAGRSINFQAWFEFAAIGRRWMDVAYEPFRAADGAVEGVVVISRDATERKLSEDALEEAERRYRALFDTMTSGVAVYEAVEGGADFVFKDFNKSAEEINRTPKAMIIGRRVSEVFPAVRSIGLLEVMQRVYQSGRSELLPVVQYQDEKLDLWVENYIYKMDTGEIVAVHEDLTARKNAEQKVRSVAKFPDENPNPVLRADDKGRLIYANRSSLLIQRCWGSQVGDLLPIAVQQYLKKAVAKADIVQMAEEVEGHAFLFRIVPVPEMSYVNLYGSDITDLKNVLVLLKRRQSEVERLNATLEHRVQEELEKNRSREMVLMHQSRLAVMGEMIGHIAHQWRQPLNALSLTLANLEEITQEDLVEQPAFLKERCAKGRQIIQRMSDTIDDFRRFFKPDRMKETFDVGKAIQDAMSLVDASFSYYHVAIHFDSPPHPVFAIGFANEYAQVILLMLVNAKDAILEHKPQEEGVVVVSLGKLESSCIVSISDNGGGVPADLVQRIFDPYFTTKDEKQGSGIGLYMAKIIIEEHMGGTIQLNNTPIGAEFRVSVPAAVGNGGAVKS